MPARRPVPVPLTSRRHFQGIFSSIESGVCPKVSRNFLDGFFLRLRICPPSITMSWSYVVPSMRIEPKENFSKRTGASVDIIRVLVGSFEGACADCRPLESGVLRRPVAGGTPGAARITDASWRVPDVVRAPWCFHSGTILLVAVAVHLKATP